MFRRTCRHTGTVSTGRGCRVTEAETRLSLLWLAGHDPEAVGRGIQHFRDTYPTAAGELFDEFADHTDELEGQVRETGTMTGELLRTLTRLRTRIKDEQIAARLDQLQAKVTVGAVREGEVSAASMRFPDGSHLVVIDHGLSLLTWHAAALLAIRWSMIESEQKGEPAPEAHDAAARAFRLATSRIAVGGRAGVLPPLVLSRTELGTSSLLTLEMDVFVLAHELAHVLLGHLQAPDQTLGVVGGRNVLLGKQTEDEFAADQLALMLMFNDALNDGELSVDVAQLRLAAVRTFLTVLEEYEHACFLFAPSTHPPAQARWEALKSRWIDQWFPDLENPLGLVQPFLDDLQALRATPRTEDAHQVHRHLAGHLDPRLWSYDEWSDIGQVARMICGEPEDAMTVLNAWQRRHPDQDATELAHSVLQNMLNSDEVRATLAAAINEGRALTRLTATNLLLAHLPEEARREQNPRDPFPTWTVSLMAQNALISSRRPE